MTDDAVPQMSNSSERIFSIWRDTPVRHAVMLAFFSLATALVLSLVDDLTRASIALRAEEDLAASLAQVIPETLHDNELTTEPMLIDDADEGEILIYRAVLGDQVSGVAFEMTGMGYAGPIVVLLGIGPDGKLLGVRVLSHAETPGLGDKIEATKSDWILGFAGLSLANPSPSGWKVRRDGGHFDQFSGATITPRAVVDTVHRGLAFFDRHRTTLLARTSQTQELH